MSVRTVLLALSLVACGSLEADPDTRTTSDSDEQGWWWLWTPDTSDLDEDPSEEPVEDEPSTPGDPDWFDAHCSDAGCTVDDGFDPMAWIDQAHDLCADALAVDGPLYFQRVSFESERVYTDEFRASEAAWEYRFVLPDPDDLWGYTWLECYVEVTAGEVRTDTTFTAGDIVFLDELAPTVVYGLDHALEDLGSWSRVNRGGIRWDELHDVGELYLVDDRWDDFDTWNASTGERD